MAIVLPDEGEVILLNKMLQTGENITMKLFTAVSPAVGESTTAADFTEATFTSYTSKTLTAASWGNAATSSGTTSSSYAQQSWTNTGASPQTILGYYYIGATSGKVLGVETFAASRTLNQNDVLNVTPKYELA